MSRDDLKKSDDNLPNDNAQSRNGPTEDLDQSRDTTSPQSNNTSNAINNETGVSPVTEHNDDTFEKLIADSSNSNEQRTENTQVNEDQTGKRDVIKEVTFEDQHDTSANTTNDNPVDNENDQVQRSIATSETGDLSRINSNSATGSEQNVDQTQDDKNNTGDNGNSISEKSVDGEDNASIDKSAEEEAQTRTLNEDSGNNKADDELSHDDIKSKSATDESQSAAQVTGDLPTVSQNESENESTLNVDTKTRTIDRNENADSTSFDDSPLISSVAPATTSLHDHKAATRQGSPAASLHDENEITRQMSPTTSLHDDSEVTLQGSPMASLRDDNDATEQMSQEDGKVKAAADEVDRTDLALGDISGDAAANSSESSNETRHENGDDTQLQTAAEDDHANDIVVDGGVNASDAQDEHEVVPPSTENDQKTVSEVNEPADEQETPDDMVDQIETMENIDTSMEDEIKQDSEDIHEVNTEGGVDKQDTQESSVDSPNDKLAHDNEPSILDNETSVTTDDQTTNQKGDVTAADTPEKEQLRSIEDQEDTGLSDHDHNDLATTDEGAIESKSDPADDGDVNKKDNKTQATDGASNDTESQTITKSDEDPNTEVVDDFNVSEDGGRQSKAGAHDDAVDDSLDGAAENNESQENHKADSETKGSTQMDETENSPIPPLENEAVSYPEPKDTVNNDDAKRRVEDDANDQNHDNKASTYDVSEERGQTASERHETVDEKVESDNDSHTDQPVIANEPETYHRTPPNEPETYHRTHPNDDGQTQDEVDDDGNNEQKQEVVQKDDENQKPSSTDKMTQNEHVGQQDSEQNKTQIQPTEKNNSAHKQTENSPRTNSTSQKKNTGSRQNTKPNQSKSQHSPRSEDDRKRQTRSASSRQRLLNRPTTDEQATRPKTTGGQTKGEFFSCLSLCHNFVRHITQNFHKNHL